MGRKSITHAITSNRVFELTINGKFPSYNEYNSAQRSNRYAGNKMKRDYQKVCEWQIKQQMKNVKISKPLSVNIICYLPYVKCDLDNYSSFFLKVFLDAMIKCNVIKNDNVKYVKQLCSVAAIDKAHPRVEVILQEMDYDTR